MDDDAAAESVRWSALSRHTHSLMPLSKERALVGIRLEVHGAADFRRTWELVARTAGAKVVNRLLTGAADRLDVVVSEQYPVDAVVEKVTEQAIPLVSADWIRDSLIECAPQPYDSFLLNVD